MVNLSNHEPKAILAAHEDSRCNIRFMFDLNKKGDPKSPF
jgi:hypothetical protein